jgi:thioredoxin-dependent peroxiredoxin
VVIATRCKMPFADGRLGEIMQVNDKAPDFTLPDEDRSDISLKSLRGKNVVLFFFPRANTPG